MAVKEIELNEQDLKRALEEAKSLLEEHIDEVNSLNVFPVPDGDTGINMFLTMKSAVEAVEKSKDDSVDALAATAARGAVLGARGNSGVILSQIMKGLAKGLEGKKGLCLSQLARGLDIAQKEAYRVVANPVEGTILTVIREVSEEASQLAEKGVSFKRAMASIALQAKRTVEKTPELLPVLKEAKVVDAGAKGLYYVFRGMEAAICKKHVSIRPKRASSGTASTARGKERRYGFNVEFLLEGENLPVDEIKEKVMASGESPLVVGDEKLLKVHIHTMNPSEVLNYARSKGTLMNVIVEDMDLQVQKKLEKEGSKNE